MSGELRPLSPSNPPLDIPQHSTDNQATHTEASQTQQDQAKQAEDLRKTQGLQDAQLKKAATESLKMGQETRALSQDFLSLVESIAQEAYEVPKASAGEKSGDHDTGSMGSKQNSAAQIQKDVQILKEFIREANYLIKNQNMDVAQMLNTLKVEQGGLFWNKIQEVLQKGLPASQVVVFQNLEKNLQEISKQFMGMEGFSKLSQGLNAESGQIQPGKAILEIIQAESNPQGALDHYKGALQILMRDGLPISAQKLLAYLRRRSGFSDYAQQAHFGSELLRKDVVAYVPQKVEKDFAHWLYVFFAVASFGVLVGLGFDWLASLLVGLSMGVVIFVFSLVLKK